MQVDAQTPGMAGTKTSTLFALPYLLPLQRTLELSFEKSSAFPQTLGHFSIIKGI